MAKKKKKQKTPQIILQSDLSVFHMKNRIGGKGAFIYESFTPISPVTGDKYLEQVSDPGPRLCAKVMSG